MDMQQEQQHPQAHRFILRLWQEPLGEDRLEWRGRVQEIASGETAFFRDWPGLIATLTRLTAWPPAGREDGQAAPRPINQDDAAEA